MPLRLLEALYDIVNGHAVITGRVVLLNLKWNLFE
jgi:hypothetical protein